MNSEIKTLNDKQLTIRYTVWEKLTIWVPTLIIILLMAVVVYYFMVSTPPLHPAP